MVGPGFKAVPFTALRGCPMFLPGLGRRPMGLVRKPVCEVLADTRMHRHASGNRLCADQWVTVLRPKAPAAGAYAARAPGATA